jgi:ATP-dependent protease ClpP protease subunit
MNARIVATFAKDVRRDAESIRLAMERETCLTAQQALEFGLIDQVVARRGR